MLVMDRVERSLFDIIARERGAGRNIMMIRQIALAICRSLS